MLIWVFLWKCEGLYFWVYDVLPDSLIGVGGMHLSMKIWALSLMGHVVQKKSIY